MSQYQPIKILPDHVTRKIAAGEVIERPASIVKELMENSVDAQATKIEVYVTNGGMTNIVVQDNGTGISTQDIPLTIKKNATSKIRSDDDLTKLDTFGFRGEALSSISAVSKFELHTKRKEDISGSVLKVDGGNVEAMEPTGTVNGTRISISNLFFNTPVRKKFLRSKSTEFSHIEKTFKKIALAHPEVHFALYKDAQVVYQLLPVATPLERIQQLYPSNFSDGLIPFEVQNGNIAIQGYVSNSQNTYNATQEIWLFVNNRWISDRILQKAILEGYRTALMEHRYPMCFVYITLSPEQLDVNVHPTKSEVRFEKPQEVFQLLMSSIAQTLRKDPAAHEIQKIPGTQSAFKTSNDALNFRFMSPTQPYPMQKSSWSPAREITHKYAGYEEQTVPEHTTANGYFSSLEVLGSLDHTYLLCRNSQTLVVIDQHAAHERVLFDQFKKNIETKSPISQRLLVPLTIALSPSQYESIESSKDELTQLGFELEDFGSNTWIVRSIPTFIKEKNCKQVLLDFAQNSVSETKNTTFQDHMDHIISTLACHAAVRAHDVLNFDETQHLLEQMDQVDLASYCPHGRPTFLKLSKETLEKLFCRV
jgi:DNA mismatch repair protein MutL